MAIRLWADADREQVDIQAAAAQWSRVRQFAARATRADADRVVAYSANYPWMRPGEVMPLAKAQVPPESPIAIRLAEASAKRSAKVDGSFLGLGNVQKNPMGLLRYGAKSLMDAGEWGLNTIKPAVREFVSGASAPLEEATGLLRNVVTTLPGQAGEIAGAAVAGASVGSMFGAPGAAVGAVAGGLAGAFAPEVKGTPQWTSQSSFGVRLQTGKSLGEGFLPGGEGSAQEEAVKRQTAAATVGGYALTPGRLLASSVAPIDSLPYNLMSGLVDARVAMRYDPGAFLLGGAGKAIKGRRQFVRPPAWQHFVPDPVLRKTTRASAGLLDEAGRPALAREAARTWLDGADGAELKTWMAQTDDFERIRRTLPGVEVSTVMELRNATTPEAVDAILAPKLGLTRGLTEKPKVSGLGVMVKRGPESIRLAARMPSGRIHLSDPTQAVEELDRIQRLMKLSYGTISNNNTAFAEALLSGNRQGAREVFVNQVLGGSEGALIKAGIDPTIARRLTSSIRKGEVDAARYHVEKTVSRTDPPVVLMDDAEVGIPSATLISEAMDNAIFFDMRSLRDIRRAHSRFGRMVSKRGIDVPVSAMEFLQGEVWRPMALLRGAWAVRVIGEEQLRMAASGLDSMFRHPASYMGWVLSDRRAIGKVLGKFGIQTGRGQVGFFDDAFRAAPPSLEDALWEQASKYHETLNLRAQSRGWQGQTEAPARRNLIAENSNQTYRYGDPLYVKARAQRLADLHRDPVVRRMAEARASGTAPDLTVEWAMSDPTTMKALEFLAQEPGNSALGFRYGMPRDSSAIERYLRQNFSQAAKLAGDDVGMWRAIASGKLDDIDLLDAQRRLNKDAVARMSRLTEANPRSATPVVGARAVAEDWKGTLSGWIDSLYGNMMARPQAYFSRGVTHRQDYWRQAERIILDANPEAQAKILEQARKAKLPKKLIDRLENNASKSAGDLSLREAHLLADGGAFDFTNKLLYDASQRSNLTDVMRIIWPFGEAQKEVMTRWARLMTENPAAPHRAAQVIRGARGAGVFTTDPQTGEEVFVVPNSGQITEKLFGVNIPLGGYAESLSFFGSGVMPGVGPALQIPAKALIPNSPEYDDVRQIIDPFGGREEEPGVGLLERHLPTWARALHKGLRADPEKDAVFGNLVADVWAAGINQGKWRNDSPEALRKGYEEATEAARFLMVVKGLSSVAGSPTPLSARFMAEDPSGKWYLTGQLSKDYRTFMEEDPDTAAAKFVEKYGENAMVYMQSSSFSPGFSLNTTDEAGRWVSENKDLTKDYKDVYSLFAPQGGEFDFASYVRQFEAGERVHLTPEQFQRRANHMQAAMISYNAKSRFGPFPSQPQREWLRGLDEVLRSDYPGYKENLHLPAKFTPEDIQRRIIPQISKAVNDERLAGNDVAEATRDYLKAREAALQAARAGDLEHFGKVKAAAPIRQWLRGLADALMTDTPDFRDMFDRVFAGEMLEDEPGDETTAEELAEVGS